MAITNHVPHVELKGFSNPVIAIRKWIELKLPPDVSVHEESFNVAVHEVGYQPYMPGRLIQTLDDVQEICRLANLQVIIQHPFVYFKKATQND